MRRRVLLLSALLALAACTREAATTSAPAAPVLRIEDFVWTASPGGRATSTGALTIRNAGAAPDRLVQVTSPIARRIEFYETRPGSGAGESVTYPVSGGVPIPAAGEFALTRGGVHLVAEGLAAPLVAGERVPMTLAFERSGAITVEAVITASSP